MLVDWFWSNTVIEQQKQEHYVNAQMDPLDKPLTTHPIQMGWELPVKPYPNWQYGYIGNPDCVFGDSSVVIPTHAQCGGLESLLSVQLSQWMERFDTAGWSLCTEHPNYDTKFRLPSSPANKWCFVWSSLTYRHPLAKAFLVAYWQILIQILGPDPPFRPSLQLIDCTTQPPILELFHW